MANANKGNEKATPEREPVHHVSNAETGTSTMEAAGTGPNGNALATQEGGGVMLASSDALAMFADDAARGMEGATQDSFAIPFLVTLQKGSPQVDEASGVAIPGARQGFLFNTVTGQMYDVRASEKDHKPVRFVPCAFRQVWIRWGSRKNGGGFKGELSAAEVADMRQKGTLRELDGKLVIPDAQGNINEMCDIVNDHRNHYGLVLDDDDSWQQALLSLTSTQIKKSKNLMANLASVKMKNPTNGMIFQPPSWANVVHITTVPEKNDKGSWMGVIFTLAGKVDRRDLYAAGKQFNESIRAGSVVENYNNLAENTPQGDDSTVGAASASKPEKF